GFRFLARPQLREAGAIRGNLQLRVPRELLHRAPEGIQKEKALVSSAVLRVSVALEHVQSPEVLRLQSCGLLHRLLLCLDASLRKLQDQVVHTVPTTTHSL
ncbi:unnamed protein product, partial [Ectocarpus fasciculatus]